MARLLLFADAAGCQQADGDSRQEKQPEPIVAEDEIDQDAGANDGENHPSDSRWARA